jgi:hypothetical protein
VSCLETNRERAMADIVDSTSSEKRVDTRPLLGASVTPRAIAKVDSRPLKELFGLTANSVCNVVFIAIDFENIANIRRDSSHNLDSQVGLAVLDTKDFHSIPSAELISTYNFASGSLDYQRKARKRFLFGESISISQDSMLKSIESLIPLGRQVVFVGHDIRHELRALGFLDFDFSKFNITTLDTQNMCRESPTLRSLLFILECPFAKLHCGSNDANFTLKALLLLAVRDCVAQSRVERRLGIMKEIALSPLPQHNRLQTEIIEITSFSRTDPETRALKKRAKRFQRSRKHQSKHWDSETQGNIRAERAAKRLAAESSDAKVICTKLLSFDE